MITAYKPTPSFLQAGCPSWQTTNSVKSQNTTATMVNQTVVTLVVPELLPLKRYTLHVRVLMFKTFEMMRSVIVIINKRIYDMI